MISIYDFTNFREYLKAYFAEAKKEDPSFSHRYLSAILGLSTPNLILLIMQGKRNLTRTLSLKLSRILRHTKREVHYFDKMVAFLQAKTHDEKNRYLEAMMEIRRKVFASRLEEWQFKYYDYWFTPIVRELVTFPDFKGDLNKLAKRISPRISVTQAKRAIKILLQLGLIKKKGRAFVQTDPLISTGPEVTSHGVIRFHRKMSFLAAESFDRHHREERDITSYTLTITEKEFGELKRHIADFRKKTLQLSQPGSDCSRVYQLNVHLFPLTRGKKGKVYEF